MGFFARTLAWLHGWGRVLRFGGYVLTAALARSTYDAPTRAVAARQVYFTAWQVLPVFVLFSALLSFVLIQITVGATRSFGIAQHALELVLRGLVLEVIPLLTALFVALRSGAAIATEVALMRISGELAAIEAEGVEPLKREFVPRVIAAALSMASLTVISCALCLVLAYAAMYGASPWGFEEFTRVVGRMFGAATILGFAFKCLLFGAAVGVIPIAAGLETSVQVKSAPVAVMGGMVRLFFALGVIEVVSLAARYI